MIKAIKKLWTYGLSGHHRQLWSSRSKIILQILKTVVISDELPLRRGQIDPIDNLLLTCKLMATTTTRISFMGEWWCGGGGGVDDGVKVSFRRHGNCGGGGAVTTPSLLLLKKIIGILLTNAERVIEWDRCSIIYRTRYGIMCCCVGWLSWQ